MACCDVMCCRAPPNSDLGLRASRLPCTHPCACALPPAAGVLHKPGAGLPVPGEQSSTGSDARQRDNFHTADAVGTSWRCCAWRRKRCRRRRRRHCKRLNWPLLSAHPGCGRPAACGGCQRELPNPAAQHPAPAVCSGAALAAAGRGHDDRAERLVSKALYFPPCAILGSVGHVVTLCVEGGQRACIQVMQTAGSLPGGRWAVTDLTRHLHCGVQAHGWSSDSRVPAAGPCHSASEAYPRPSTLACHPGAGPHLWVRRSMAQRSTCADMCACPACIGNCRLRCNLWLV